MPRAAKHNAPDPPAAAAPASSPAAVGLLPAVFAAGLVVLLLARGLSNEDLGPAPVAALSGTFGPTAAKTMTADVIMLVLAAITMWSTVRALGVPHWMAAIRQAAGRWLPIAAALLTLAAAVSSSVASNRFYAIDAGINFAAIWVVAITLGACLHVHTSIKVALLRFTLAALLASLGVFAAKGVVQQLDELPATRDSYREHRQAIWQQQGVALDSPQVRMFEARLFGAGISSYYALGNVAAAVLAVGLVLGVGVLLRAGGVAIRLAIGATLVLNAVALWLCDSRAAIAVAGLGVTCLGFISFIGHEWINRYWRPLVAGSACLVGLVIMVIGGIAIRHDGLPDRTLTYRYHYVQGSASMLGDQATRAALPVWLVGVGRENFRSYYLGHKRVDSPEAIATPHNMLAQAWTELGLAGLAGLVVLWFGVLGRQPLARPADAASFDVSTPAFACAIGPIRVHLLLVAAGVSLWTVRQVIVGLPPENAAAWLIADTLPAALLWVVLAHLFHAAVTHAGDRLMVTLPHACGVALGVIILLGLVDVSTFEIGAGCIFAVVVALHMATTSAGAGADAAAGSRAVRYRRIAPWLLPASTLLLIAFALACSSVGIVGVEPAEDQLARERAQSAGLIHPHWRRLAVQSADPALAIGRAEALLALAGGGPQTQQAEAAMLAQRWAQIARQLDPAGAWPRRLQLEATLRRATLAGSAALAGAVPQLLQLVDETLAADPHSWPLSLALAMELDRVRQQLRESGEPVRAELDEAIRRVAGRARMIDAALRDAGEALQIMSPEQQHAATSLGE